MARYSPKQDHFYAIAAKVDEWGRTQRAIGYNQTIIVRRRDQNLAEEIYQIVVGAQDDQAAAQGARSLADDLRAARGVLEAGRTKGEQSTMDLGAIVTVIASSGATLAIARGVEKFLGRTRGTTLKIEKNSTTGSIKAEVHNINPEAAIRITEIIM